MQILLIGNSRSGTTLLRKLISLHPQVHCMLHETWLLHMLKGQNIGRIMWDIQGIPTRFTFDLNESWGEKILTDYPCIDYGVVDAVDYCLLWREYFKRNVVILIVRHPIDVIFSMAKKRGTTIQNALAIYKCSIKKCLELRGISNVITIHFEDLVLNPVATLTYLFDKIDISSGFERSTKIIQKATSELSFGCINKNRAYANRKEYKATLDSFTDSKVIKETMGELCYEA